MLKRLRHFFRSNSDVTLRFQKDILPIALALLGSFFIYTNVASYRSRLKLDLPQQTVLLAAEDIDKGDTLSEGDLVVFEMPEKYLPMGTVLSSDMNSIRGLRITHPIAKGELLIWSKLDADYFSTGPAGQITPGYRSISVHVTGVSSVAQAIRPGDRVDLIATIRPEGAREDKTFTLLQNVTVLDVGDAKRLSNGSSYSMVSLMVLPKEVTLISHAQYLGTISFVLRHPKDDEILKDLPIVANHQVMESGFRNSLQEERNQGVEVIKGGLGSSANDFFE